MDGGAWNRIIATSRKIQEKNRYKYWSSLEYIFRLFLPRSTSSSMYFSSFSYRRFFISFGLIFLWFFLCGYAISSESIETTPSEKTLWIVDNSLSMAVEDMKDFQSDLFTSRLNTARSLVMSGVDNIRGEHGIILYARNAGILTPFTSDHIILEKSIANITPVTDNGWSDISSVFALIYSLYSIRTTPLHIILLTDGGDTGDSSLPPLPSNTTLSIIGIGTDTGWPIFLGYDAIGHRRYKFYEGKEVTVPYESKNIDRIASLYHVWVLRIEKMDDLSWVLKHLFPQWWAISHEISPFLIWVWSLTLLFWLFLHPYVRTTTR